MNCFFDEKDAVYISVKLASTIKEDRTGYFMEIRLRKSNVISLMEHGVIPKYDIHKGFFKLIVRLSNITKITVNGLRLNNLADENFLKVPYDYFVLKEMVLKKYSDKTKHGLHDCYATKIVLTLPSGAIRKLALNGSR